MKDIETVRAHFAHVTDALGKPIDDEIFETVIALNACEIPTVLSCGGHIDKRGLLMPYVDIEPDDKQYRALVAQEREMIGKVYDTRAGEDINRLHALQDQIRLLQLPVLNRLVGHLSQFYEVRHMDFDVRLIITRIGGARFRLQNQGGLDFWFGAAEDVQRQKLAEYRAEMAAFTVFLMEMM